MGLSLNGVFCPNSSRNGTFLRCSSIPNTLRFSKFTFFDFEQNTCLSTVPKYKDTKVGEGAEAQDGKLALLRYATWVKIKGEKGRGIKAFSGDGFYFLLGGVKPGESWKGSTAGLLIAIPKYKCQILIKGMKVGGKRTFFIEDKNSKNPMERNSIINGDLELLEVKEPKIVRY